MHESPHLQLIEGGSGADALRGIAPEDRPAYFAWARLHDNDRAQLERFTAAYCGAYDSPQAWALSVVASLEVAPKLNEAVPLWFRPYVTIDLGAIARDFVATGEVYIERNPSGGVWVFDVRAK